jgi:hypothetical protein
VLEQIRVVISIGLVMLLLLLRLDAERFGAAEYDEPANRFKPRFSTRLSWYVLGFALLGALYWVHPQPQDVLYLILGLRGDVLLYGALLAVVGVAQAAGFAYYHYRKLRLPSPEAYPGAGLNDIATAVIDEATFRGALLGMLLAIHLPAAAAVLAQAVVYALVTRMGVRGRHPYMLALSLGIGVACGWATVQTGGIGAAILGHAMTSFALFVFSGHAGQIAPRGGKPEGTELSRRVPEGWQDARQAAESAAPRTGSTAEPKGRRVGAARVAPRGSRRRVGVGAEGRRSAS